VNFVGHATVAGWEDDDPRYSVGAMLPDLCRMAGSTSDPRLHDEVLRRGVDCHHRVDAVFHAAPTFVALAAALRRALRDAGVSRAPALAAGHVGVELLLDGQLLRRHRERRHWDRTTAAAASLEGTGLAWGSAPPPPRWSELCRNLGRIAHGYRDVATVHERVLRILERRPRLAAAPSEHAAIGEALELVAPVVAARTDALLAEVHAGLEARR
jgi:hypothetical protein